MCWRCKIVCYIKGMMKLFSLLKCRSFLTDYHSFEYNFGYGHFTGNESIDYDFCLFVK